MRIEEYTAQELFELLNELDETDSLEAKSLHEDSTRSIMESVCAFSNEPGMGGGVILLGARESKDVDRDAPLYVAEGVDDPDKAQLDISTQCASMFNIPVRPRISVEKVCGRPMLKIFVPELPTGRKPLYFKRDGLPSGAFRRVGSSDQHCTADDIGELLRSEDESYDEKPMRGVALSDIDEAAVSLYRKLRSDVNPMAEELKYDTPELLESLGCLDKDDKNRLNVGGLLLFGSAKALRRAMPTVRVDYIRVQGNEWVANPDESFRSVDMRGSLLMLAFRVVEAVNADLPKGFLLSDEIQAKSTGLPVKVLREAVVNALMHADYRVGRPLQVIRYDNRIEIINAGYSLKPENDLGSPGSVIRNKIIAPVFHDTNLAEMKGSGIRRMRRLMSEAQMSVPTYESDRIGNSFTMRLLLHHFLGEDDLAWLAQFKGVSLDDDQRNILVFLREVGAVDNRVYRQFAGCDTLKASAKLSMMRDAGLLEMKGRGKATYYVPGDRFPAAKHETTAPLAQTTLPQGQTTLPQDQTTPPQAQTTAPQGQTTAPLAQTTAPLPKDLVSDLAALGRKAPRERVVELMVRLCSCRAMTKDDLVKYLKRSDATVKHIAASLVGTRLSYLYPEVIHHPNQAYVALESEGE